MSTSSSSDGGLDGREIANFILDYCDEAGRPLSNLALQKIIFFCHAWSLIELNRPLVKHQFEAWEYGPVLQYLYHQFKHHKEGPITSRASRIEASTGKRLPQPYSFDLPLKEFLQKIVGFYSKMDAGQLVRISHVPNGPWDMTWNHPGKINPGMKIDNDLIRAFYSKAPPPLEVQ